MIPSTEQIMMSRHRMLRWLRRLELILFIIGLMPLVWWGVDSLFRLDYWTFSGIRESLEITVMFCVPGVLLAILDRRLVKWIVPLARLACPQCGHSLVHLTEPRCSECGCPVPHSLVGQSPDRPQ